MEKEKIKREKETELAELKKQLLVAEAETAVVTAAAGDGKEMEALVAELDTLKETTVSQHQPNSIPLFNYLRHGACE